MTDLENQESDENTPAWWMLLAPVLVMGAIFALSSRSQLPDMTHGNDIQNVIGHFTAYAALGATLALLFRAMGWSIMRALLAAIVIATLYGVSDEFHQSFVPNRNVDSKDVLVDFLGATAGALAMVRLIDYRNAANVTSDAGQDQPADGNS